MTTSLNRLSNSNIYRSTDSLKNEPNKDAAKSRLGQLCCSISTVQQVPAKVTQQPQCLGPMTGKSVAKLLAGINKEMPKCYSRATGASMAAYMGKYNYIDSSAGHAPGRTNGHASEMDRHVRFAIPQHNK